MSKHTPGPWQAVYEPHVEPGQPNVDRYAIHAGKRRILDGFVINGEDARLIAAAPDLLEALRNLLHDIESEPEMFENAEVGLLRAAHTAIAKAEGREP